MKTLNKATRKPGNNDDDGHEMFEGHDLTLADMSTIWSVGKTPRAAIEALCQARWQGKLESDLTELSSSPNDNRFDWGFRFLSAEGTGFKAAGINVPGGVILTWWK